MRTWCSGNIVASQMICVHGERDGPDFDYRRSHFFFPFARVDDALYDSIHPAWPAARTSCACRAATACVAPAARAVACRRAAAAAVCRAAALATVVRHIVDLHRHVVNLHRHVHRHCRRIAIARCLAVDLHRHRRCAAAARRLAISLRRRRCAAAVGRRQRRQFANALARAGVASRAVALRRQRAVWVLAFPKFSHSSLPATWPSAPRRGAGE